MNILVILWISILVLLSIWLCFVVPTKSILIKYPYSIIILGLFNTSILLKISIEEEDYIKIQKFYFAFRIWCLLVVLCPLLFALYSLHESNSLLMELKPGKMGTHAHQQ